MIPLPKTKSYETAKRLTQEFHAAQNKTFSGQFTWKKRKTIKEIIDRFDIKTILDYGCGKGKQYDPMRNRDEEGRSLEEYWGISPTRYDPGIPEYSSEPQGKFDLVVCVQVLGSIPLPDLPIIIDRLYDFAEKAVFVSERIAVPHKKVYESIEDLMPRGLKIEDWEGLLKKSYVHVPMIAHFRQDGRWTEKEI